MKIGILTLPLVDNYGGILQAFALHKVLQSKGFDPYLINRRITPKTQYYYLLLRAKYFVHRLIGNKRSWVFSEKERLRREALQSRYTKRFVDKYITPQTKAINTTKEFLSLNLFDAYIVGSDQVWRPEYIRYINVYDYFLDFLQSTDVKRISYAASFGTEDWTFTKKETEKCRNLIKKFTSVSVREDSAVLMCRNYFDVDASHVLDPTMLMSPQEYINSIDFSEIDHHKGNMMTYILDNTEEKKDFVNIFAEKFDLIPFNLSLFNSSGDENNPTPSVESWILGFQDANFILTDSFHGVVFSILFNKPFIAIGNEGRGLSRFSSLLKKFQLENRLIKSIDSSSYNLYNLPINWEKVNMILEEERSKSISFILNSLK